LLEALRKRLGSFLSGWNSSITVRPREEQRSNSHPFLELG
jgi:hypothetical protein